MTQFGPLKLIYIAGYGRSGSTLLDIGLGEHPDVFGAGEIGEFTRRVWAMNEYCACGSRVRSCPLWSKVFSSWTADRENALAEYLPEQTAREKIISWRRLFRIDRERFGLRTRQLLLQISLASGRPITVDSNKVPGRGFVLASTAGVELYVVHLVRDPRAVVFSMMKTIKRQVKAGVQKDLRPKPLLHTALRWVIVNLAAEALVARVGRKRSIRVRYEEFVANPHATLRRVLGLVGKEPEQRLDDQSAPLRPHHQVSGSRHRMQKQLLIRSDETWRWSMSPLRQLTVAAICAPLLWRYGYAWRAHSSTRLQGVRA